MAAAQMGCGFKAISRGATRLRTIYPVFFGEKKIKDFFICNSVCYKIGR